jgi:hypothetical protein
MKIAVAVASLLLVAALPVFADPNDIVVGSTATASIRAATSLTFAFTVDSGANRYMIVEVATGNGRDVSSVTYGGVGMTRFASEITPGTKDRVVMYEYVAPPSGTANVVITLAAGGGVNFCAGAIDFDNVNQSTPRRATAVNNSQTQPGQKSATISVTVASQTFDVVVDAAISSTGSIRLTAATDQAVEWNIDSNNGGGGGGETNLGCSVKGTPQYATSSTMTWTLSNQDLWAIIATSLIPAISPSEVRITSTSAEQDANNVVVSWKTTSEVHNLGFNVYRQTASGPLEKVNGVLIAGGAWQRARQAPEHTYRWRDTFSGGFVQYFVEDIDVHGVKTMHGPITPVMNTSAVTGGNTDTIADLGSIGGIFESPDGIGAPVYANATPTKQQISQQYDLASDVAAKIFVTTEGWTRVRKSDLVAAGFDPGTDPKSLSLFADGLEIPIAVSDGGDGSFDANDTIAFYGTGIDTPSTGAHAYWLVARKGRALRIAQATAAPPTTSAASNFPYAYQRIERTVYFAALINNGDRENFFGAVVSPWPVSEAVNARGFDGSAAASLDVVIQGASDGPHVVDVQFNGSDVGTMNLTFQQRQGATLTIPSSLIAAGTNTLTFTALGGDDDISVVESARLTYAHRYAADRDALKCTATGGSALAIDGFTLASVTALDITDPLHPAFVPLTTRANGATWTASLTVPGSGRRTILAFADDRVLAAAQIAPSVPSNWHDAKNAAQFVILSARPFIDAVKPLKTLRSSQGLSTVIVDVQDIYDEFGFGHRGTKPIRDFLAATRNWKVPPHYLLLAGDASFDPRNYFGWGAFDFVPSKAIPTTFLRAPSDDWFADFDDTGLPSIAIGRLPARTAADASAMVAKIINRTPSNTALLFSDGADADYDFASASAALVPLLPAGITPELHDFAQTSDARSDTIAAMNRGGLIANYIGHGSIEIWANYVYTTPDARAATNRVLPFVVDMECLNGYFHDIFTTSLGEGLMLNPNGGAVAVWASSGLTFPDGQNAMNRELYRQLFGGTNVIGDAILKAKAATNDLDVRKMWVLFGDPTMGLR